MFVFESSVFPPKISDRSKVKRLEDTNGDGKPDRSVPLTSDLQLPPRLANWGEERNRTIDREGHWFVTRAQNHVQYQAPGS